MRVQFQVPTLAVVVVDWVNQLISVRRLMRPSKHFEYVVCLSGPSCLKDG